MIDDGQFKLAMSHFASGVTIVTTEYEGQRYGMTVASFASLSLHPPLVLVCVEKSVKTHEAIAAARQFGVSILSADQAELSNRFASRIEDKFAGVDIRTGSLGVPIVERGLTTLECELRDAFPGGDHTIFVGEVRSITVGEGVPLLYYRSGYRDITA